MKHLIEFDLEDGSHLFVESEEFFEDSGLESAARTQTTIEKAAKTFEASLESVRPSTEAILKRMSGLSQRPHEIEVEFALRLDAQVGAVIASGTVGANYTVKLKWSREKSSE